MEIEKIFVFLRGINVNGIKIKMDSLKDAFIKMDFDDVKTVLATGNVIFSLRTLIESIDLKKHIEAELSTAFNYEAHVIIRSFEELQEIIEESKSIELPKSNNLYVLICESEEARTEIEGLFNKVEHTSEESIKPLKKDLFWSVSKGQTLSSKFGAKVLGSKGFKDKFTSRNISTIERVFKC